jgi:hypothetical protein
VSKLRHNKGRIVGIDSGFGSKSIKRQSHRTVSTLNSSQQTILNQAQLKCPSLN